MVSYREEKPPNPKIDQKYHPTSGLPPQQEIEKYPENNRKKCPQKRTNFASFEFPGRLSEQVSWGVSFFVCWGYFEFLAFPVLSKPGSTPAPWAQGCETKSKNGRSRLRKPFISRVFCAQRGIETMVSDHGLGRGQTMG